MLIFTVCSFLNNIKSKLQVLSFIFTPNYTHCHLVQKSTSFVLDVTESCTLCPLAQPN
ncbi:hypothetical protein Hanom_Chr03g00247761 [Helianthus anomalus]